MCKSILDWVPLLLLLLLLNGEPQPVDPVLPLLLVWKKEGFWGSFGAGWRGRGAGPEGCIDPGLPILMNRTGDLHAATLSHAK